MSTVRTLARMPGVGPAMLAGLLRPRGGVPEDPGTLQAQALQVNGLNLDSSRLAAYRSACGFPAGNSMPVTWPFVWLFPLQLALLTAPDWPIRPVGLVHLGIDFHLLEPLQAGEAITGRCRLGTAAITPRGLEFEMLLELEDPDGQPVWRGQSRVLARDRRRRPRSGPREIPNQNAAPELALVGRYTASPRTAWHYARVSADWNPIHLGWLGARMFGFRQPVAHGMWSVARALAVLESGDGSEAASVEAVFKAPLYLPSQVSVNAGSGDRSGRWFEVTDDGGRTLVTGRI